MMWCKNAQFKYSSMNSVGNISPYHHKMSGVNVFHGEWDDEGLYFYQAYCDDIAAWAVESTKP